MKGTRATLAALFLLTSAASAATAFAESIPYEFTTVDIRIPGSSVRWTPDDINGDGVLLTNVRIDNLAEAVIASPLNREITTFKTNTFSCTGLAFADTSAWSIDDKGQIVGYCADAPSGPSRLSGFVRRRNGDHILLDFPGADHTLAFGISERNQVVGHYYNPLIAGRSGLFRIHGFLWDGEKYSTIDFPRPNTYTMLWSINKSGQILGECYTFDPATNETLGHNWFVYDNGNFIMDFAESLEHIGGPAIHLADMNDNGQIVGLRSNGGPDWNGAFLYRGGTFFDIEFPSGWLVTDVRGMNNKGQFVGMYAIQVGIDPFDGSPIYEDHGYIARAGTQKKTGKPVLRRAISLSLSESNSIGLTEQAHDLIKGRRYSFDKQFESLRSLAAK
jgi:hypothetical protein